MGMSEDDIKRKSGMTEDDDIAHDVDALDDADDLLDEDSGDQEWESYDSEEGAEDAEEPAPRRRKGLLSFNTIVITIAVVFGGAFIAMQLSRHAPKQEAQPSQQQASLTGLQMVGEKERKEFNRIDDPSAAFGLPPEPKTENAAPQEAGLPLPKDENIPPMPGIPEFGDEEKAGDSPQKGLPEPGIMAGKSVPDAVAAPSGIPAFPDAATTEADVTAKASGDVLTPMPDLPGKDAAPVKAVGTEDRARAEKEENMPPLPKADDIFKASGKKEEMPSSPVKKVETQNLGGVLPDAAALPAVETPDGGKDIADNRTPVAEEVSSLEVKLSDLGGRLDRLEKKIGEAPEAAPESEEIKTLKETVKRLESRLSEISSARAPVPPAPARVKKTENKESKGKTPSSSAAKPVRARTAVKTPGPALTAPSPALEIRAAQPGQAWVARPGDNDLQGVSIGDSLPGIGRVTAITRVGGRWVVEGTHGRLSQ